MRTYNLLDQSWIPVRRRSGKQDWIAPHQIADRGDPPVALDTRRSDLDASLLQFLVGLLQTAYTPVDRDVWAARLDRGFDPSELQEAFSRLHRAFWLDGDGPRFLQFAQVSDGRAWGVHQLMLDAPGENAIKKNSDLFVRRESIRRLSLPAAAVALIAYQTHTPGAGSGHFTSIRGGGPLTTMLVGPTLWESVWLNVLPRRDLEKVPGDLVGRAALEDIFPWLREDTYPAEWRRSGLGVPAQTMSPLHHYWAVPGRMRLQFEETPGRCDLLGVECDRAVTSFLRAPAGLWYGPDYEHPLSPHYCSRDGDWLAYKGKPQSCLYSFWPRALCSLPEAETPSKPALVLRVLPGAIRARPQYKVWVCGFDTANSAVLGWYTALMPMVGLADPVAAQRLYDLGHLCADAATAVMRTLQKCISAALFAPRGERTVDLGQISADLAAATTAAFYATLQSLAADMQAGDVREEERLVDWLTSLRDAAMRLFRQQVQPGAGPSGVVLRRVAWAHHRLARSISPRNRRMREIVGLSPLCTEGGDE